MINFLDLELNELKEYLPNFRSGQVFSWISKGISSFDEMSNIPKDLREELALKFQIELPKTVLMQESKLDGTKKFLFELSDGMKIESVFMKYKFGNSICVSSQAGCRMGCKFCASTINGLERNMTAGEIYGEVLKVQKETGEKINHIVIMGTGEPFDNYDNVAKFIRIVNDKNGLNIGMRNITVSTCGIVPMIDRFGDEFSQVNLAISLHQVSNEERSKLMPINKKYPIDELLNACKRYVEKTNRRVTFEYTLVKDTNDRREDALKLASLLHGMLCHVNLIPLNAVAETGLKTTEKDKAVAFQKVLESKGIPTTIRRELGDDIDAACGQLRLNKTH